MANIKEINVEFGQSLIDLALMHYGCYEGIYELIRLNPSITDITLLPVYLTPLKAHSIVPQITANNIEIQKYITESGGINGQWNRHIAPFMPPPPPLVYDVHAEAYLIAASIIKTDSYSISTPQQVTGLEIWNAVDTYVKTLKIKGIWNSYIAIWLWLGDTATSRKFNLKNPLDTNAAYRLAFAGGITHGPLGFHPNGTNGFADTFINPSLHLNIEESFFGYYNQDNTSVNTREIGASNGSYNLWIQTKIEGNNRMQVRFHSATIIDSGSGDTSDLRAVNHVQREGGANVAMFNRKDLIRRATDNTLNARPNAKIALGALSTATVPNSFSSRRHSMTYVGNAFFSPTQYIDHVDAIDALMLALKRNVV